MKSVKMTKMEQMLVVVAVAVVCMFFFMKKAYDPLTGDIKSLVKKNNDLVAEINTMKQTPVSTRNILQSINKLQSENESLEQEYREIRGVHLTPKNSIEEAVMRINETAANNALMVKEIAPETAANIKLPPAVQGERKLFDRSVYRMKMSGDFLDFITFVKEIAGLKQLVSLTGLDIERENNTGQVEVTLILLI